MIVDTSVLLAFFDNLDAHHAEATRVIDDSDETLVISPFVLAELDHLLLTRYGVRVETAVLNALTEGAWELADFSITQLRSAVALVAKYADERIGLADASNVVLAETYHMTAIATLDRRHFGVLRFSNGHHVTVVP